MHGVPSRAASLSPPCVRVPSTFDEPSGLVARAQSSACAMRPACENGQHHDGKITARARGDLGEITGWSAPESGQGNLHQKTIDSGAGFKMATQSQSTLLSKLTHDASTKTCLPDGVHISLSASMRAQQSAGLQTADNSEDMEGKRGGIGVSRCDASTPACTSEPIAPVATTHARTAQPATPADVADPAASSSSPFPVQPVLLADTIARTGDSGSTDMARPARRAAMRRERRRCSYSMHSSYTGLEVASCDERALATSEGIGPTHSFGGSSVHDIEGGSDDHAEAPQTSSRQQRCAPSGIDGGRGGRLSADPAASPSRRVVVQPQPQTQSNSHPHPHSHPKPNLAASPSRRGVAGASLNNHSSSTGLAPSHLCSSVGHVGTGGDRIEIGLLGQLRSSVSQPTLPARTSNLHRQSAYSQPRSGQPLHHQHQQERHLSLSPAMDSRTAGRPASAAAFAWRAVERRAAAERAIIQGGAAARDAAAQRVAKGALAAATGAMTSEAAARRTVLGSTWCGADG